MNPDPEFEPILKKWGSEKAIYAFLKKEFDRINRSAFGGCLAVPSLQIEVERTSFGELKTQRQARRYELILGWAFLTCLALGSLAAGSARASTISGETVIFQDLTDTVSVGQTGGSRFDCSLNGESAACVITAPTGATFQSSTLINNGDFNILEPGTTDTLSDQIAFVAPPFTPGVNMDFVSDSDPGAPGTAVCGNPSVRCVTEDGTVQTAGTITWSSGTNCSDPSTTCIVDTIQFQSDVETPTVPEPGTLVLFGSGLISIVGTRRKILAWMF